MTAPSADLLESLIEATLKAGADAVDARIAESASLSVEVRNGDLETVEREELRGLALRALVGKRQATVSATDLSPDALKALSERVVAMARLAPEDKFCGIAGADEITRDLIDLQLDCDDMPEADELERRGREMEAVAMAVPGVKQMAHCGDLLEYVAVLAGCLERFPGRQIFGISSMAAVAIAERDGAMERDHESSSERRKARLKSPEWVGREAANRSTARLGARKLESQTAAVIYREPAVEPADRRLHWRDLGPSCGARRLVPERQDGQAGVRQGRQPDRRSVARWRLRIARAFDGEGRPVGRNALVEDGMLTQWLLNGPSARQLGLTPNGFASTAFGDPPGVTTSNLDLQPGERSLAQLMADAGKGLLVTDMFGPSLNPNTGDYSVGVSGISGSRMASAPIQFPR